MIPCGSCAARTSGADVAILARGCMTGRAAASYATSRAGVACAVQWHFSDILGADCPISTVICIGPSPVHRTSVIVPFAVCVGITPAGIAASSRKGTSKSQLTRRRADDDANDLTIIVA